MSEVVIDSETDQYVWGRGTVEAVLDAVERGDSRVLGELLEPLHPADAADLLEQVGERERIELIRQWPGGLDGDILSELSEAIRDEIVDVLPSADLADAVRDLESDDVVDLVEDLDVDQQQAVLDSLEPIDRIAVEKALAYPEESAGRLMQVEVVRVPDHWSVGQATDFIKASDALPEHFYHVILVGPHMRPTGYVALGRLLGAPRQRLLSGLVEPTFRTIPVDQDEGEVAYAFNQYHLISAPVVDEGGRLVGVITIDDAMAVLDDEAEEDILRLAGVGDESEITDSAWDTTRHRLPWLAVNLITAILASLVISLFEDTISGMVALAVLMPIVASMGGNGGTQSLTVAVRGLATKDLTSANIWRVMRREVLVGLINGLLFAVVMGAVGVIWFDSPMLGVVIGVAMVVNMIVAGIAGTGVPFILQRVGVDPALASGAFVTTVTDIVGFFAFLGLAGWMLL